LRKTLTLSVLILAGVVVALGQTPVIDPVKGIQNGASFIQGQPVAAGSFVAIFGSNLASGFALFDTIPLSASLAGVSVTFNGVAAPIIAVSSGQINAIMPWDALAAGVSSGPAQAVVKNAAGTSTAATVQLTSAAPGLFDIFKDSTGVHRPSAYNNSDGTLPLPPNIVVPGFQSRPAKINDPTALILFAAGLGLVDNRPANGVPGLGQPPYSTTVITPTVLVGGVPAKVTFSGLSPQYPMFYQIAIVIQPGTPTGDAVSLQIDINGIRTTDQLKIAVTN
jgi:uncharacterized protein (TIGR03437 family)